jgi:hypothetical protein
MLLGLSNVFIYRTPSTAENVLVQLVSKSQLRKDRKQKEYFELTEVLLSAQYHCGGQLRSRVALRSIEFALLGTPIMHCVPMFGAIQMQLL